MAQRTAPAAYSQQLTTTNGRQPRSLRALLLRVGPALLARLLGTADGHAVAAMAARELSLILRSREWHRLLALWTVAAAALLSLPILFRSEIGSWQSPTNAGWFVLCGYGLQVGVWLTMVQWTVSRLRRDLYNDRLDELLLTRCSAADIAMGEALAAAVASLWLVLATAPVCVLLSAMAGHGIDAAVQLALTLAPTAAFGVWFGMGWGLAFTLRRSAAIVAMTDWWVKTPMLPIWFIWAVLGFIPLFWGVLALIPGGKLVLLTALGVFQWVVQKVVWHLNPLLTIGAAIHYWPSTWLTDWLVLVVLMLFMMRKSMDAIQISLATLPERDIVRKEADHWIHHDGHFFTQYSDNRRRQANYRDGGNPIAAFDVALGHRVYLHPFLWAVAIMLYLFLLAWSLLVPTMGADTGVAAVLVPATGALLLMSGGVAVSFGWERDQHRWPTLAVLPVSDLRLALGKIKGVVRPTLWVGLVASLTALLLGWRGAIHAESALWLSLHVLLFPVTLAFVSATLALTTPTVGEAIFRWAVLGAIPTLAFVLPPPIGGEGGLALPFSPPFLVLILVLRGPSPELIRGAWISLGLEVFGILASLLILGLLLRRWTVGERD